MGQIAVLCNILMSFEFQCDDEQVLIRVFNGRIDERHYSIVQAKVYSGSKRVSYDSSQSLISIIIAYYFQFRPFLLEVRENG